MFRVGPQKPQVRVSKTDATTPPAETKPALISPDSPGLGLSRPASTAGAALLTSLSRFRAPVMAVLLGAGLLAGCSSPGPRMGAPLKAEMSTSVEQRARADAQGTPQLQTRVQISPRGDIQGAPGVEFSQVLAGLAHISEQDSNPFDSGLSLVQQKGLLDQLAKAVAAPRQSQAPGAREQMLQASAAVLLLDLARVTSDKDLKSEIVKAYAHGLENSSGVNRRFMILDLERIAPELGSDAIRLLNENIGEVAPTAPPYASWFANGNDTIKVDYYVGRGFWDEEADDYEQGGFKLTENPDGTRLLEKTITFEPEDGPAIKTKFEITMHDGRRGLFTKMNDPDVHMVVYSGHSDYGRAVPGQLRDGTDLVGDKVFMGFQCGGKGTQDPLADKYPGLTQIQTKNSSYGYQDRKTFSTLVEGIARRADWAGTMKGRSFNYYGPADRKTNESALDRDQDGRADIFDRVASHDLEEPNSMKVKDQLKPVATSTAAYKLDGSALHAVGLRFHRMIGYSEYAEHLKDQSVLNDGFFEGGPDDPLLKLAQQPDVDGKKQFRMSINKSYANASEAVLGAAVHFELGRRFAASEGGYSPQQATAAGLLLVSKALSVDLSYYGDSKVFDALTKYAGIEGVSLRDVDRARAVDHDLSGGKAQVKALLDALAERGVKLP